MGRSAVSRAGGGARAAPGRWRNTLKTTRSVPGTHTVRRPRASALTVASATAAGVVANGAAFIPSVIDEWTNPGRTTSTLAPVPARESPRPWANPSRPGLRRAVHEVRLADPLAGDARQHDEAAVALAPELRRDGEADADRARVVDGHHLGGAGRVVVELVLVDELAERQHDDVEVAVLGDEPAHEVLVGGRRRWRRTRPVVDVDARVARSSPARISSGRRPASTTVRVLGDRRRVDDGPPDVAGAAEQHDGLWFAEGVVHGSAPGWRQTELQAAGEVARPDAGRDRRTPAPPATRRGAGSPGGSRPGVGVGVLGEVVAAAGAEHEVVEPVERASAARGSPSARRR